MLRGDDGKIARHQTRGENVAHHLRGVGLGAREALTRIDEPSNDGAP